MTIKMNMVLRKPSDNRPNIGREKFRSHHELGGNREIKKKKKEVALLNTLDYDNKLRIFCSQMNSKF